MNQKIRCLRKSVFSVILTGILVFSMGSGSLGLTQTAYAEEADTIAEAENHAVAQSTSPSSMEEGIDPAFQQQKIGALYSENKLSVMMPEGFDPSDAVKIEENADAEGTIISGSKKAVKAATFIFADEFDFGEGIVDRILTDGLSVSGSVVDIEFFLDDSTEAFASVNFTRQTKKDRWESKNMVTSVYDQKITGKHRVSFKLVQKDGKSSVKVKLNTVIFEKSTVPTMYFNIDESLGTIDAMNSDPQHNTECYGSVTLQIPEDYVCEYGSSEDLASTETIPFEYLRGRGNSTWAQSKRPYKVKFEKNQDFFHMGANKHWVLIADYFDPSHIRNKFTYWMASQLGFAFTPQSVYVDVVMNGEYYGSYLLAEQIRVDQNRVEIDNLEKDAENIDLSTEEGQNALTGGYLLSLDEHSESENFYYDGATYAIASPSEEGIGSEELYAAMKEYIQGAVQNVVEKLKTDDYEEFSQYIDIESAMDYYWMQEFSANGDAFDTSSTYLYKARDAADGTTGKFYWGPVWDFDFVAWGNNEFDTDEEDSSASDDAEDESRDSSYGFYNLTRPWYKQMIRNESFSEQLMNRWNEKIKVLANEAIEEGGQIDQYAEEITYAMYYNNLVYGSNYSPLYEQYTFLDAVDQLKEWIAERSDWIDDNIDFIETPRHNITFMYDGAVVGTSVVYEGDLIDFPDVEVPEGMLMDGWYGPDENGDTVQYDRGSDIVSDIILELKFTKISDLPAVKKIVLGEDYKTIVYQDSEEGAAFIEANLIGGVSGVTPLHWSSSDDSIASVDTNGVVRSHGIGEAVITCETLDGSVKASCVVCVKENYDPKPISDVRVESITVEAGETGVLSAVTNPKDANPYEISWHSTDPKIEVSPVGKKAIVTGTEPGTYSVVAAISTDEGISLYRTCTVTITEKTAEPGFTDVDPDAYYADAVSWAVDKKVTTGTSSSTFSPNQTCSRGQVVTFLWRAAGQPEPESADNPFADVDPEAYYYKAVLWAVEKGVTTGMSEDTFSPDKSCTRAQVVTFQHRAAGSAEPASSDNPFADVPSDTWFSKAVLWAVEKSITTGTSETEFSPEMECTRGQIVTFLFRQYGKK